jgi:probable rRNA maturation factor
VSRVASRRPARLAVSVALDGVAERIPRAPLKRLAEFVLRAEKVRDALVSIALVSPRAIARINREHLGHAGPTDVISFAFDAPRGSARPAATPVVADVYIAPAVATANARRYGVGAREELQRLVVHGTLHALGWDHDEGAAREHSPMWARQERLLRAWRRREARA